MGEHDADVLAVSSARLRQPALRAASDGGRPLEGLRILDFGVIVYGAEVARLFCELGADVIKVESREFPDGARVSPVHFAIGHRGSKSVGVNLRSDEGVELIKRLAGRRRAAGQLQAGTLAKLGLGEEVLHDLNPGLVIVQAAPSGRAARGAAGWDTGRWSAACPV